MVTPLDKNNGDIKTLANINGFRTAANQAALDGDKFTYSSYKAFGDAIGSLYSNQYIASRGPTGWASHGITPFHRGYLFKLQPVSPTWDLEVQFKAFTADLSSAFVTDDALPPLTEEAVEGRVNLYRRHNDDDSYEALTTTETSTPNSDLGYDMEVGGHSEDGAHAVFNARAALTPDAAVTSRKQVYDFSGGELNLVSILPEGAANTRNSYVGTVVTNSSGRRSTVENAVSDDGSRIYWTSAPAAGAGSAGPGKIYVRVNGETTVPVSESISTAAARYWTASTDGSKAIFAIGEDLYKFDLATETSSLIAGGASGVVGASDDASRVYFVSSEALASGAVSGERNLYLDHDGSKTFVASLSPIDIGNGQSIDQVSGFSVIDPRPIEHASRVSADGGTLAFQSVVSLTGYDNTDVKNGEPNLEVFVYDADEEDLACVSCRPSGARPDGQPLNEPFRTVDSPANNNGEPQRRWTAAWLTTAERETYFPRALSEDGNRLYFNAFDALLPQDTNGAQDVYQWEKQGSGSCKTPDGCLSLISTGKSPVSSEFVDASADGRDVFFSTQSSLDPRDAGLVDIYDAREGGGHPLPPPPPTPCLGDACQSVPPGPNDATPASAGFRGAGSPSLRKRARRQCKPRTRGAGKPSKNQRKRLKRCRNINRGAAR